MSAVFAVLVNLMAIAFFGVNTALFAILAREAVRPTGADQASRREATVLAAILVLLASVMAAGTILAVIIMLSRLT